ncbi:hypothetical protein, partial [Escherichia coli]|uniref:hypothetical protein n=1 Tax=Escherichia coli TaxID=562 RepID=UPI001BC8A7F4
KTSIFSHSVYLFLREFSLQDSRGGSVLSMLLRMNAIAELMHKYWKPEKKFIAKLASVILSAGANSCVTGNSFRQFI